MEKKFKSQRKLARYITVNYGPEVYATALIIARGHNTICDQQFQSLRKVVDHLKDTGDVGIQFCRNGYEIALSCSTF